MEAEAAITRLCNIQVRDDGEVGQGEISTGGKKWLELDP